MQIGIPKESLAGERLVAATPKTVKQLISLGYDVIVEHGAGNESSFIDTAYAEAGATIGSHEEVWGADIVAKVNTPEKSEVDLMRDGSTLIALLDPGHNPGMLADLTTKKMTGISLDAVPRISRAQALDVLSTLSNVAGYRSVIEAAEAYGGMFAGQVTAAGKTVPAQVFVIGAGVAGLAAIGAAVSLGAQVRAFDVRPEVGEEIGSMGATFVRAEEAQQEVSTDGYARELTEDQERKTLELYAQETAAADVVITTALVRGRAIRTITKEMVANMRPGSVIVDLAASGGGNCELTVPGKSIVTDNGVTIIGYTDFTSRMPQHTSQLFGTNIVNILKLMTPDKDGQLEVNLDDIVVRGMVIAHEGETLWPPPPVRVSAAPTGPPVGEVTPPPDPEELARIAAEKARRKGHRQLILGALGAVLALLAMTFSPPSFVLHFTVFAIAVIVGYYVIFNVTHALHTPLMSQTNAISGIILVGAMLQLGNENLLVTILAFIGATVASINIFGGFLVTHRMLGMFRKEG